MQLYPGWSARDNYAQIGRKKKRPRDKNEGNEGKTTVFEQSSFRDAHENVEFASKIFLSFLVEWVSRNELCLRVVSATFCGWVFHFKGNILDVSIQNAE